MLIRVAIVASAALLGIASSARASANLLVNGGLEKAPGPYNQYGMLYLSPTHNQNMLPGWTVTNGTIDIVPASYWQVSQGSASVDLIGTPGVGGIEQTVSTSADSVYTLTFDLTANPEVGKIGETGSTKVLLVEALAADGTTVLESQTFDITKGTRTKSDMQWTTGNTLVFTATGDTSTILFKALTPLDLPVGAVDSKTYTGPVIDNVSLVEGGGGNPTPEPASLGVMGAGAALLLMRRRRTT